MHLGLSERQFGGLCLHAFAQQPLTLEYQRTQPGNGPQERLSLLSGVRFPRCAPIPLIPPISRVHLQQADEGLTDVHGHQDRRAHLGELLPPANRHRQVLGQY